MKRRGAALVAVMHGGPLPALHVPSWETIPGLVHGFLGRDGGASTGEWSSLNLSFNAGDEPAAVKANWVRVRRECSGVAIVTMRQVHGATVVRVDEPSPEVGPADGLVTGTPGIGLGVLTADCVPILMIAPQARVALAVHAGWRGTIAGIGHAAVVAAERELGVEPEQLLAALGPAIGGCCYEVEAHIGGELERRWGAMPDAWRRHGERGRLDLRCANRKVLTAAGVPPGSMVEVGPCTACDTGRYFSYRASGGRTGRQLSFVGWR